MRRAPQTVCAALLLSACLFAALAVAATSSTPDPKAPPLVLPRPIERKLANGLRVIVLPSTRLPIVQMQLLVPAGIANEPDSLPGLAALTAQLVRKGTTSRSADAFDAEAAQLGASFATSAGRDYALAVCAVGSARAEQALELLSDAALGAVFGDEAFEAGRHEVAGLLRQQNQDMASVADDRVWAAAFGAHPYAHQSRGDIDALLATNAEKVRVFHREHWRPDRAVLVIAGDIAPERAFAAAEEWFGRWAGRAVADRAVAAPTPHPGVRLIDLTGAPYTELRVAAVAPGRGDPAWAAWQVLAHGLEHGLLPAGFHASLQPQRQASLLVINVASPTDSAAVWAARIRHTLEHIAEAPPAGAGFETLRREAANAYPLQLQSLGALISQWQAADDAGLGADALEQVPAKLAAVTPEAFAAAAHALARGLTVVAAGPGDKLRRPLSALGKVEDLDVSETRTSSAVASPATAEQRRLGRIAMNAAVLAHGGATRLAAVHTLVREGDMTLYAAGTDLQGSFSLVSIDPDRLSFATKMLQFENRQAIIGDQGWSLSQGDTASLAELDSAAVVTMRASLHGDLVHLLREGAAAGSDPAVRGKETLGSRLCDLVEFTGAGGRRARFAIDRVSHRVLAIDTTPGEDGLWHDRRLLTDFRQVGGLWLPYSEERFISGERVSLFASRVTAINRPIPETLFKRPRVIHGQLLPSL